MCQPKITSVPLSHAHAQSSTGCLPATPARTEIKRPSGLIRIDPADGRGLEIIPSCQSRLYRRNQDNQNIERPATASIYRPAKHWQTSTNTVTPAVSQTCINMSWVIAKKLISFPNEQARNVLSYPRPWHHHVHRCHRGAPHRSQFAWDGQLATIYIIYRSIANIMITGRFCPNTYSSQSALSTPATLSAATPL